jgi:hypothetical protein
MQLEWNWFDDVAVGVELVRCLCNWSGIGLMMLGEEWKKKRGAAGCAGLEAGFARRVKLIVFPSKSGIVVAGVNH